MSFVQKHPRVRYRPFFSDYKPLMVDYTPVENQQGAAQSRLVLSPPASPPTSTLDQATGTSYSPGWCCPHLPALPPPPWTKQQVHPTVQAGALSTCQPSHLYPATGISYSPGWCCPHLPALPPPPWTRQQVYPTVQAGAVPTCQPSHLHPGPCNRYILQSRLVLSPPASPPTYTLDQATGTSYSPD